MRKGREVSELVVLGDEAYRRDKGSDGGEGRFFEHPPDPSVESFES